MLSEDDVPRVPCLACGFLLLVEVVLQEDGSLVVVCPCGRRYDLGAGLDVLNPN